MAVHQYVNSLQELEAAIEQFKNISMQVSSTPSRNENTEHLINDFPIFIIVSGTKDENGVSWCPDCEKADPVLEEAEQSLAPEPSAFITVYLTREEWKNPKNVFRTDGRFRLTSIPTMLKWPNREPKLVEAQCADIDAIKEFFDECCPQDQD
ncbi:thioredoxin domain-containing protein 17-like [Cloeon dipterum]|uniref:thioredoxin domain-containing protein 17-like n=1 Tax=Cloeon dipterum TaxID=197152 RepID=UPI00322087EA